MNRREEIIQAIDDFQEGRMGVLPPPTCSGWHGAVSAVRRPPSAERV